MSQATIRRQAIPAPRGVRNSATRIVASTVGMYGGLIGIEHGIGEILQGNVAPGGLLINAIGPQAQNVWQGHEPALILIPNFFVTGSWRSSSALLSSCGRLHLCKEARRPRPDAAPNHPAPGWWRSRTYPADHHRWRCRNQDTCAVDLVVRPSPSVHTALASNVVAVVSHRLLVSGFHRPWNRHLREQPEPFKHACSHPAWTVSVHGHCCIRARHPETDRFTSVTCDERVSFYNEEKVPNTQPASQQRHP
jgi:hypothetical protein